MTKHRWKGSVGNHIDPENEEQLKWVKIEIENTVKRILKLTKSINHGNKEANLKKKSEAIHLIEDFHKQYESLYSLYEDLRGEVKKRFNSWDDNSSASNSDSESYYTPEELNLKNDENNRNNPKGYQEFEASDTENTTILKDKLTSTSEVKKTMNLDPESEFEGIVNDLSSEDEDSVLSMKMKELEGQVSSLKLENGALCRQKREMEEKYNWKANEIEQLKDKILRFEAIFKENECQFSCFREQSEGNEKQYLARISELEAQADNLNHEMNNLQLQKGVLEERLSRETEQKDRVEGLLEEVNSLKKQLEDVNRQQDELEWEIERKSKETTECVTKMENLSDELRIKTLDCEEKERLKIKVQDLEAEISCLRRKKSELEEQIMKMDQEKYVSELAKQELHGKISELETAFAESENKLLTQEKKFNVSKAEMCSKITFLTDEINKLGRKLDGLQLEKKCLVVKLEVLKTDKERLQMDVANEKQARSLMDSTIADQKKSILELDDTINKLRNENEQTQSKFTCSKSNIQLVEKKMEEMAEVFRKQFEDKYRILSRRIRVAEQLHVENKEWYQKTTQENSNLKERVDKTEVGLKSVKEISLTANDVLTSLDCVALKFEEYTGNFLNRISKASCELKFSKDWAMRKNKALRNVKDDLDCLLAQLDEKESEILLFRERVWKSENKIRELEKTIKEREDGMLGLSEEKREAIRQLCVWIDYHRSRSDYYKKMLSEMNLRSRRVS